MKLGSLFDGIGGFPLAAMRNGIIPVWASEIEAAPISITKRHFPDMVHLGDITKIDGSKIEPVDIITFGSPCQDLSLAGKRKGLSGGRSGLFMEAVRIIKEMRGKTNGKSPARIIWENVTGAFSSNEGEDFRTVLQEIATAAGGGAISIPRPSSREGWLSAGTIVGNGWSLAWRVLDAQYWGVPQRRKRIFIVADFGGHRSGEILFKPDSMFGNIAESETAKEGATENTREGISTPMPNEMDGEQYAVDFGRTADRIQMNANKSVTLLGEGGGCGAKTGLYCLPLTYCIQGNMIGRDDKNGPQGNEINEDISFTLNTIDRHAVATMQGFGDYKISGTASSIKNRDHKDNTDLVINNNYIVRRLTPTECERLQGFPDGWTEYGLNPDDYKKSINKGMKRTGLPQETLLSKISDSKRYMALGNSLAIPCVDFLMSRISEGLHG